MRNLATTRTVNESAELVLSWLPPRDLAAAYCALRAVASAIIARWRGRRGVTPRVTEILTKLLKMQLSLKARANQVVKVANPNLNYQDFKFEVSKCYLVWTDILSPQNFEKLSKLNQTTLLKEKLFLMNCSTSVQIYKKLRRS
jgi:hypothetical protein